MKIKKFVAAVVSLTLLTAGLAGCAKKEVKEDNKIVVGATPVPHAEILNYVKPKLKEKELN